jgi:hypothetical protein|tara:strand:- start:49 stop:252 length:204 start_codon:yes stop_codon:yes gene_type:complete
MEYKLKFNKDSKPMRNSSVNTVLPTGVLKAWKPNLWQKILYKLKIKRDPRYNGKKINCYQQDEIGHL